MVGSHAMTLKIDNAGRLVIPKPLRDRMRLDAGADLEVEETAEGAVAPTDLSKAVGHRAKWHSRSYRKAPKEFRLGARCRR